MALACVVMYIMAGVHCVLNLYYIFSAEDESSRIQAQVVQSLHCLYAGDSCTGYAFDLSQVPVIANDCALSPLLLINVSIYATVRRAH